jgi:hypothetical protein
MKRESNTMTRKAEQEFERRMEAFFSEIFPEHAQCGGSCRGHQLPDMAKRFLKEMGYPADLKSLTIAARSWFERIDLDASGSIDINELDEELKRLDITVSAASSLLKYHDTNWNGKLEEKEFHNMVLHILENVHATFSAEDMLALGCLINKHDKDGNGTLDIVEFKALASDLVKKNFLFNGREGPETLDLNQLYILREYNWKRRKMQELEEDDKGPDNRQDQIDAMKDKFLVEKQPSEGGEALKEPEPIYVITEAQKEQLVEACALAKTLCDTCFPDLRERADALQHNSKDLLLLIVELKKRIYDALQREIKQRGSNRGFESLFEHTENTNYVLYLDVERHETALHSILLQHVGEIAAKLHKEGVIEVPTLEWDGALGREEEVAIERLGFLLNA